MVSSISGWRISAQLRVKRWVRGEQTLGKVRHHRIGPRVRWVPARRVLDPDVGVVQYLRAVLVAEDPVAVEIFYRIDRSVLAEAGIGRKRIGKEIGGVRIEPSRVEALRHAGSPPADRADVCHRPSAIRIRRAAPKRSSVRTALESGASRSEKPERISSLDVRTILQSISITYAIGSRCVVRRSHMV